MAPNGQKPLIKYLICLLLAGITLAAFAGVANAGFIVLDDGNYVVNHPAIQYGFSWKSLKWAFSSFDSENWHPLIWLSLMLDYQAFGLNPTGYHLINLTFHVANTVLLFLLLEHLTARSWPSAFVALLFGIHPMHVESVAWVSERKDVLSAFFFLLTLITYIQYVVAGRMGTQLADGRIGEGKSVSADKRSKIDSRSTAVPSPLASDGRGEGRGEVRVRGKVNSDHSHPPASSAARRWLLYMLTLFLFALGLMSKPMLVTLPFVLLLLDFWPLKRFALTRNTAPKQGKGRPGAPKRESGSTLLSRRSWAKADQRLVVEKIPFFILMAFCCYITYLAQKSGGAVRQATEYSILQRLCHVPISYAWYILKFLWPVSLSIYYELHPVRFGVELIMASLLFIILTWFALANFRKYPYFLFGWLWFLGMMVPVIGIVQVGSQAYADRYAYLPYIGLFIILAWGVPDLLAKVGRAHCAVRAAPSGATSVVGRSPVPPRGIPPGLRAVAAPLAKSAVPPILCVGAVIVAIACFIRTVQEVGYWKDGVKLFERAVALDPKNETALTFLGAEYSDRHDDAKALDCMKRALAMSEKANLAWQYVGFIRTREGDYDHAADAYQNALNYTQSSRTRMDIYNNLGQAYKMATNFNGAISAYQSSLAISSDQPVIQTALGECFLESKQPDRAAEAYQAAVDLDPNNVEAQSGLGMSLASAGRDAEALGHFRAAVQADTNSVMGLNNLAWTLAVDAVSSLRDGPAAVSLAERACQLTHYQDAQSIGTLAAAYAEVGRFDDAIATARRAHDVALAHGERDTADRNAQLLKLYEVHKPYHMGDGR